MKLLRLASLMMLVSQICLGQGIQWIGIDSRIGNVMAQSQNADEWCWAASAQMILNFYGNSTTQSAIVRKVHHDDENRPGSPRDITSALNGWRVADGKTLRAVSDSGLPSLSVLIEELSHGRPIYITFSTGPRTGHAVIITGAALQKTQDNTYIRALVLRDPWPSPQNIATRGRVQLNDFNLASFAQTVNRHWIITPTDDDVDSSIELPDLPRHSSGTSSNSCSQIFDSCMERQETQEVCEDKWQEGCMQSCQNDYGNSYSTCRNNFCSPSNGPNAKWASMCRTQVRSSVSICRNRQRNCESRSR